MQLRPYQISALNKIWEDIQTNLNVLCQAPTGAGKTIAFAKICQRFIREMPQGRILILVDREILVTQSRDKLLKVAPELKDDIGICCSSVQNKKELEHKITIASRQTLINQLNYFQPVNIIILDEAHLARIPQDDDTEKEYDQFQTIITKLKEYNPKTRLIGFSATPYRLSQGYIYGDKNTKGCQPYFPELNYSIAISELMAQGFLSPLIAKTIISDQAKNEINSCKITAGEFNLAMLADIMSSGIHVNSAVEAWKEHASYRKKTLCFCTTIEHCEIVAKAFNDAGIPAIAIHSKLEDDDLTEAMNSLDDGNHKIFCSVAKLTTGLDVPDIDCILALRPTKSTSLWIQIIGRGLRIAQGKTDCLCLDLSGNFNEHGTNLDKPRVFYKLTKKSDSEKKEPEAKQCPSCAAILHPACRVCPDCEYIFVFQTTIDQQPELRDVVIGPDIRTFPVTNMTAIFNHSKKSGKDNVWVKLHFEDPESDFRSKFKSVSMWLCFPNDGYSGYAVIKARETMTQLSCSELPIHNDDGTTTWPESALECLECALDMFIKPVNVTVDMSGKWPELKSFSYDDIEDKQEAFGGRKIPVEEFIKDYIIDEEDIPF